MAFMKKKSSKKPTRIEPAAVTAMASLDEISKPAPPKRKSQEEIAAEKGMARLLRKAGTSKVKQREIQTELRKLNKQRLIARG